MFFDFKSPTGPLFIAKQNVLSLTNVSSSKGYIPYKQEDTPNSIKRFTVLLVIFYPG